MKTARGLIGIGFCLFVGVQGGKANVLCSANPNNLVTNCGFETGDFTGWSLSGNDVPLELNNLYGVEGVDPLDGIAPHSGNFQVFIGDLDSNATTLSQTLSTEIGTVYNVSFFVAQDTPSTLLYPNEVLASFGGVSFASLTGVPVEAYTEYSYTVTAESTSSVLSLTIGNGLGEFLLDDVSVTATPTPEPASVFIPLTALLAVAVLARKRIAQSS